MLHYAIVFLIIAIIAAVFGFTGIAGTSAWIAHVLCVLFLILFIISLILRGRPSVCPKIFHTDTLHRLQLPLGACKRCG